MCTCGGIENAEHYLLYCPLYSDSRREYLESIPFSLTADILLKGSQSYSVDVNSDIFIAVQKFIQNSKRFN